MGDAEERFRKAISAFAYNSPATPKRRREVDVEPAQSPKKTKKDRAEKLKDIAGISDHLREGLDGEEQ